LINLKVAKKIPPPSTYFVWCSTEKKALIIAEVETVQIAQQLLFVLDSSLQVHKERSPDLMICLEIHFI